MSYICKLKTQYCITLIPQTSFVTDKIDSFEIIFDYRTRQKTSRKHRCDFGNCNVECFNWHPSHEIMSSCSSSLLEDVVPYLTTFDSSEMNGSIQTLKKLHCFKETVDNLVCSHDPSLTS